MRERTINKKHKDKQRWKLESLTITLLLFLARNINPDALCAYPYSYLE